MKSIFTKQEMNEILQDYNIGKFKYFGKIKKDDVVSFGQIIGTTEGRYFMKILRKFDKRIEQSLRIAFELYRKKFPTYKTYLTKNNKLYVKHNKERIVFYEFIPNLNGNWKSLNLKEINNFAKALAKFHKLTKEIKITPNKSGNYAGIKRLIRRLYRRRYNFDLETRKVIRFMYDGIKILKTPREECFTGYFSEFNPGHVLLKNNKVKYVIDWDMGKEEAFFDYGSSMTACFSLNGKKLYPNKLMEFIKAYNKERKLTQWEKVHLFDAFKFGIFKYGVWGFINLKTGNFAKNRKEIDEKELNKLKYLMNLDEKIFNDKIKGY